MSGSDGRYMSIDSGPSAVSMARSVVSGERTGTEHRQGVQQGSLAVNRRCGLLPSWSQEEERGTETE